ncbi:MAG: hypothetical protein PHI11_12110 [Gallionella sp.]|nr:hypothetical protein [Gallionella sp.]
MFKAKEYAAFMRCNALLKIWQPLGVHMKIALFLPLIFATATANAEEPVLSATGYGAIKFGAKLSDVEKTVSEHVAAPANDDEAACRYVQIKAYPEANFMVEQDVITRADVSAKAKNNLNISVGERLAKVTAEHPSAHTEPHHYDPSGYYLIFKSAEGKSAIVMEVGGGKITDIRAGLEPSVEYIEGCL